MAHFLEIIWIANGPHNLVSQHKETLNRVSSNEACSAAYKNFFHQLLSPVNLDELNAPIVFRSLRQVEDILPDSPAAFSPLRLARREKILDAAELLFSDQGFRATTMESVAAEARVSKVTLYGYFKDKDLLFEAVANRVAERLLEAVRTALSQSGDPGIVIADALNQKHQIVWDLARGSAFSNELFAAKNQFAAGKFTDLDRLVEAEITQLLKGRKIKSAKAKARILFGAAKGVANRAENKQQLTKDISDLVSSMLRYSS